MKKRILSLVLAMAMLLSIGAGIVPNVKAATVLPTYSALDDFGSEVFSYYSRNVSNGVNTEMTYSEAHNFYMVGSTANYIAPNYLSAGADPAICSMLIFTAPYTGTITISNGIAEGIVNKGKQWDKTNYAACYATIYSPSWSVLASYAIPASADPVATPDITGIEVTAGQQIKFLVGSNTAMNTYINWAPVISYTASAELHTHEWQEAWVSDETHHWHECDDSCYVTENSEKDGYAVHTDANKDCKCDVCGHEVALSYNLQDDFQSGIFTYYSRNLTNGVQAEMTWNESANLYMVGSTSNYIAPYYMSAGVDPAIASVAFFTAPYTGTITISNGAPEGITNKGNGWDNTNFQACYANILAPNWSQIVSYSIPANNTSVETPEITGIQVTKGQQIKFMVGSNAAMNCYIKWIPTVTYTEITHEHEWQEAWTSNATHHWHECDGFACDAADTEKDGYAIHSDADKDCVCDVCGAETALSYDLQTDFQSGIFTYYSRNLTNGVQVEMEWNESANLYMVGSTSNYIAPYYMSAGVDPAIASVAFFTAPYTGTITISNGAPEGITNKGNGWDNTNFQACYANILAPNWSQIASYSIPANNTSVETPEITGIQVTKGQQIKFMVGSNAAMNCYIKWIPVVTYTEVVHEHEWSAEWTANATHHWHECLADDCDAAEDANKDGYGLHIDLDKDCVCDTCNAEVALFFNAEQDFGTDVFAYYYRNVSNGETNEMSFNTTHNMYMNGSTANYIASNFLSAGVNPAIGSMVTFTAPYDGIITISNGVAEGIVNKGQQWDKTNYAACYANIYGADWSLLQTYAIPASADPVATPDITGIEVRAGDVIKFLVGSNTAMNSYINWAPIVTYTYSSDFEPENPVTYYISSSEGSDSNNGLSETTPWKSIEKLNEITLYAGDTVRFKAGDTWYGAWEIDVRYGSEEYPITFTSYGEGAKPDLCYYEGEVQELQAGICLKLINANGFVMNGLSIGNANLGMKLYYDADHYESDYVRITNCHFHDIYGVTQLDEIDGIYFSAGITTGMEDKTWVDSSDAEGNNWPLRGLYIDNCTAYDAGSLVAGPSGVFGFYMTDCVAEYNGYYGTTVYGCRNGYIDRCVFKNNGSREMPAGSCGIMVSATDFTIKNTIISGQQRQGDNHDGCGIDFEHSNQNVTVENCLFQNNAGVGVFYFTSGVGADGTNYNANVLNCYFINNNQNPDDQEIEYEVFASGYATSGCVVSGNKYYYSSTEGSATKSFSHAWDNNDWTLSNNIWLGEIPADLEDRILNADNGAAVDSYNVSLGDNLNLNFYLDILDCYKSDAVVTVTVAGTQAASYTADQIANGNGEYVVTVELAAAQMTEEVTIQIASGDWEFVNKSYSVRGYAEYILDDANGYSEKDKVMVQAMLHYGAAAQEYFDVNLDDLANANYTDSVTEEMPSAEDYSVSVSGSVSGIRFYGASLLFKDRIAVRFYFTVTGDGTYTVNGKALTEKDDLWYVEFADIAPQDLDQIIEAVVSDANGSSFTVSYSPLHYIVRQYNKTENAELKALVQNLYDYYKAAEAYVA